MLIALGVYLTGVAITFLAFTLDTPNTPARNLLHAIPWPVFWVLVAWYCVKGEPKDEE